MHTLTVPAYGKINLTLRVLGQRPDGFHEVSTIFQSIALQDTLTLSKSRAGICLKVLGAPLTAGHDNLVYRAAAIMQQRYKFPGVNITLKKRIPIAAGLAGGSTDAAATLLGLNYLYSLGLTPGQLAREGATLGSDVPFCVLGGTALGRGRGEELYLLPRLTRLWLVLVKPGFGVSTEVIYKSWDANPGWQTFEPPNEETVLRALSSGERQQLISALGNELEGITCRLYPEVKAIKSRLVAEGAERAIMCGSGPAVFGVVASKEKAVQIAARLKQTYPETIVTHTL